MKTGILAASLALVVFVGTAGSRQVVHQPRSCGQLFTVHEAEHTGRAVYADTRHVGIRQLRLLGYIERCQRNPQAQGYVRAFDHAQRRAWTQRRWAAAHPAPYSVLASWYNDAGNTACGFHATDGVANRTLPCGTTVTLVYGQTRLRAVVDDRGPFIVGRTYDLNQNTRAALACPGLCGRPRTSTPLMASAVG